MQTTQTLAIAGALNTRLNIVTATPAPKAQSVSAPCLTLSPEQVKLFNALLDAKRAKRIAERTEAQIARTLALPRYEGREQTVIIKNTKGKQIGEIQVSMRAPYSVGVTWPNKITGK